MSMKSLLKILAVVVVVVLLAGFLFLVWASSGMREKELRQAEVLEIPGEAPPPLGQTLKIMTWNIGFGGGLTGNPTDRHPAGEVRDNLEGIASLIHTSRPDIVFLQEVDRPSSRTGRIDQALYLLRNSGMRYACFVSTWRNRYVPFPVFPFSAQIGGVHSGQMILSRYPITECRRIPLPQPTENAWWYNRFFLNRAILHAIIAIGDGPEDRIDAINIHLEAFHQGNRERQAGIVSEYVSGLPVRGRLVMAGDFNSIPPDSLQKRGFADEDTDFSTDGTIGTIRGISGLREVFLDYGSEERRTDNLTFPAGRPSRRLDYVFYRGFQAATGVVPRTILMSDHLPVVSGLRL